MRDCWDSAPDTYANSDLSREDQPCSLYRAFRPGVGKADRQGDYGAVSGAHFRTSKNDDGRHGRR
jgi:hypothetical protein